MVSGQRDVLSHDVAAEGGRGVNWPTRPGGCFRLRCEDPIRKPHVIQCLEGFVLSRQNLRSSFFLFLPDVQLKCSCTSLELVNSTQFTYPSASDARLIACKFLLGISIWEGASLLYILPVPRDLSIIQNVLRNGRAAHANDGFITPPQGHGPVRLTHSPRD